MSPPAEPKADGRTTRRQFAQALALTAAAPLIPAVTQAQEPSKQEPPKPDPLTDAAEALTAIVRARYGKHLTDEQLQAVKRSIQGNLRNAERLRQFPLKNSDEPAFAFSADHP